MQDENGEVQYISRTLEWMQKPVHFKRPQADFVRGRDYSFATDKEIGVPYLSLNTLGKRIHVSFDIPAYFNRCKCNSCCINRKCKSSCKCTGYSAVSFPWRNFWKSPASTNDEYTWSLSCKRFRVYRNTNNLYKELKISYNKTVILCRTVFTDTVRNFLSHKGDTIKWKKT